MASFFVSEAEESGNEGDVDRDDDDHEEGPNSADRAFIDDSPLDHAASGLAQTHLSTYLRLVFVFA